MVTKDIFTMIDHRLTNALTDIMGKTISNLSGALSTPLTAACTIYIAFIYRLQHYVWAFFYAIMGFYSDNFQTWHHRYTRHKSR